MKRPFKTNRRHFLKTLLNLSALSILPIKLNAFQNIEECITTSDIEGPFYIPNSPNISILTPPEINSNLLFITGTVYANDCITPIPLATIDIWHANQGEFDTATNSYINSSYEDQLYRAKIYTDNNGNYAYQTILPGKYLNGNSYRPSHIHYKSSYLEKNELTTQLYFEGDTSIESDPWASSLSAENRIIPLTMDENKNLNGVFDITLDVPPSEITSYKIEENYAIRSIYPNPIDESSVIELYNNTQVFSLDICDVNGRLINRKNNLTAKKIILNNILDKELTKGIYLLKIKTDEGHFDAKRFIVK